MMATFVCSQCDEEGEKGKNCEYCGGHTIPLQSLADLKMSKTDNNYFVPIDDGLFEYCRDAINIKK